MGILEKLKTIASTDNGSENFKKMVDSDSSEEIPDELPSLPKMRSKSLGKSNDTRLNTSKSTITASLEAVKRAAEEDSKKTEHETFDDFLELDNLSTKKENKSKQSFSMKTRAEEVAMSDSEEYALEDSEETEEVYEEQKQPIMSEERSLYFRALAAKINDDESHEELVEELSGRPQDFMKKIEASWKKDKHDEFSRKLKTDMNSLLIPLQKLEQQWREMNFKREDIENKIGDLELSIEEKTLELNKILRKKVNHVKSAKTTTRTPRKSTVTKTKKKKSSSKKTTKRKTK